MVLGNNLRVTWERKQLKLGPWVGWVWMLRVIADFLAAAMQGDEGYIADFYRVAGWGLTAIGGFGEMGRHFEAEEFGGTSESG